VGAEKKGFGGLSIVFLCSQIYNFWGLLITIDERQRPANEARMGKRRAFASTLNTRTPFFHSQAFAVHQQ